MSPEAKVRIDLNNSVFQQELFGLTKKDQNAVLKSLKKISKMTWCQIYQDSGLNWEKIISKTGPHGGTIYSIRLSRGFRAVVFREENWMRFLTLHPDHDSAY